MNTVEEKLMPFSRLAVKALLYELVLSPKPGLVDRYDTGAHDDMDFYTFTDSIVALDPFLASTFRRAGLIMTNLPKCSFTVLEL